MDQQTVVGAGASGDLGTRITAALVERGAAVRALVRDTTDPAARERLARAGATPVDVDPTDLASLTAVARTVAPDKPEPVFPAWQGMAYMVDMFSGDAQLEPLDVDRYPGMTWTGARERLGEVLAPTIPTA